VKAAMKLNPSLALKYYKIFDPFWMISYKLVMHALGAFSLTIASTNDNPHWVLKISMISLTAMKELLI
jgi:hypothetical protein